MSSVLRNLCRSSIISPLTNFYQWLKSNQCILCRQTAGTKPWCEACLEDLPWWKESNLLNIPLVDTVKVSFQYEYPINRLIQSGKYRSNYGLVTALADLLPELYTSSRDTVIYPVPISRWKLLKRGFNQTGVLACKTGRYEPLRINEVSIHKRCFLPDQSTLDSAARKDNARNLFYASRFNAAKHAVIVDDVITTGATASAVAKILRTHGAHRVDVYALAAVP